MRRTVVVLLAALVVPSGLALPSLSQDDAGTGTDAADSPEGARLVAPSTVHEGNLSLREGDHEDWYALSVERGDRLHVRHEGYVGCYSLYRPDGSVADANCYHETRRRAPPRIVVETPGVWRIRFEAFAPFEQYGFSYAIDRIAPYPGPGRLTPFVETYTALPGVTDTTREGPHVVVAVIDTGVNPYHAFFRAPALEGHPSEFIAGFPTDAVPIELTLDEPVYADAFAADEPAWRSLRRGSSADDLPLYTFPGTRIIAAASFSEYDDDASLPVGTIPVLDENGHGTRSVGLAAGADLPLADGNVLIVSIETDGSTLDRAIRWAARQPWIDIVSLSWGTLASAPQLQQRVDEATAEVARAGKALLVASGNGVTATTLGPDHCQTWTSPLAGPTWVVRIGAAHPANGNPTYWHCVPADAIARTDVPSTDAWVVRGATIARGTSAATPNVAGHLAALLLAAHREGVHAAPQAALDVLVAAARPAAMAVGAHDPSAPVVASIDQGHGLIDAEAIARALPRLLAREGPEPRPDVEPARTIDRAGRELLWGTLDHPGLLSGLEDAASGRSPA